MLQDRVQMAVPNPGGPIGVGSTFTLGAAEAGYRSFLTAFGAGQSAYVVLTDGATRTLSLVCTVNAGSPETLTVTEILWNDRTGSVAAETFASACVAFNAQPSRETLLWRSQPRVIDRRVLGSVVSNVDFPLSGGFSSYRLRGTGIFSGTAGLQLSMRISRDNLSTVDSGSTDYANTYRFESDSVNTGQVNANTMLLTEALVANAQAEFEAMIQPGTAGLGFHMRGNSSFLNAGGTRLALGGFTGQRNTAGRATHVRIIGASMAVGAVFTLEGIW